MAGSFACGFVLAISIIIGLIFAVIGLFLGHTILFDSVFLAVISRIVRNQIWHVCSALCVVIAIILFAILFWLQNTKAGSWIIRVLFSALWAFVFGFFAHIFTGEDMVWFHVVMGLGFILMMGLHLKARDS